MDRRQFVLTVGGGLTVLFTVDVSGLLAALPEDQRRGYPTDLNAYLRIHADGRVSLFTGKIEMGQGVNTSLSQMLAEELDVPLSAIDAVLGDTDLCPWDMGTFGSMTTRFFGPPLRHAGAEARSALLELASERLGAPIARLDTRDARVFDARDPGTSVAYAELVQGRQLERRAGAAAAEEAGSAGVDAPLEPLAEHTVCGVAEHRVDGRDKVTGDALYAGDIRLPDMLYASILRPPAHGARLVDVDTGRAGLMEDARVVRDGDLVAVLHPAPDVAMALADRIAAKWEEPEATVDNASIFNHLVASAPPPRVVAEAGNVDEGRRLGTRRVGNTYYNHYVAHAPMEPHTALARVDGDGVTVWASTQTPFPCRDQVAKALGVSPGTVRVITPFVGGGFGGKTYNQQAVEAARLAQLAGRPVQVMWSRGEEFFYDRFRPAAVVKTAAALDDAGRPVLWELDTLYAGDGGAEPAYRFPHARVTSAGGWQRQGEGQPLAVGPWRAPGANTNTFAAESQIDALAALAGRDPVSFRLDHLADPRAVRTLRAAADRFGGDFAPAPSGRGVGVAVGLEVGTWVAAIANVAVDRDSGRVRVERIVAAQDMGEVINPEGATMQVESCLTMGLGYALAEEVRFRGGAVLDRNFGTYHLPRFSWVPGIEVILIDNPDLSPQGGGEPAIPVVGAVIASAIHDATGARLTTLPMTAERVRAAVAAV